MKIYIQSKSGNYNTVYDSGSIITLKGVLKFLRASGGFESDCRDKEVFVPFEEIEYIRAAQDGE
jgi:hypothetical protein